MTSSERFRGVVPIIGRGRITVASQEAELRASARILEHRAKTSKDGSVTISAAMARQVALWLRGDPD